MRVALVTRDFPPVPGGISTHVDGLLKGLRRLGVDVDPYVGRTDTRTLLLPLRMPRGKYDLVHVAAVPTVPLSSGLRWS